jgi:hypothetical protein
VGAKLRFHLTVGIAAAVLNPLTELITIFRNKKRCFLLPAENRPATLKHRFKLAVLLALHPDRCASVLQNTGRSMPFMHVDGHAVALQGFYRLLHGTSGPHYFVPACQAFDPEIHSYPQHCPAIAAAGVRLFHYDHIVQPYVHRQHPFPVSPAGMIL